MRRQMGIVGVIVIGLCTGVVGREGTALGCPEAPAHCDSRVRAEEIDGANLGHRTFHESLHVGFQGDVGGNGQASELPRHRPGAVAIEVCHHHATSPLGGETTTQCGTDAAGASGHNNGLVAEIHGAILADPTQRRRSKT